MKMAALNRDAAHLQQFGQPNTPDVPMIIPEINPHHTVLIER